MKLKLMQKLTIAAIATFLLAPVYGTVTGPVTISSLSANALDRSGYLEVLGSNFGGSGRVLTTQALAVGAPSGGGQGDSRYPVNH